MSDMGAVILTVGERSTSRALASLRAQTLPIDEVTVVAGVRPFHRALNAGAAAVSTPFFLQVDADMVLDPDCAERLREAMGPEVGIAVGSLRDPLMGTIAGVKLFRRECFDGMRLGDALAPELDFQLRLGSVGWQTRYVAGAGRRRGSQLGDHRPTYAAAYAFGTYFLLGARYGSAGDVERLTWRFRRLRRSSHRMAPVARPAMGHGVFAHETRDVPKPRPTGAELSFLRAVATSNGHGHGGPARSRPSPPHPPTGSSPPTGTSARR